MSELAKIVLTAILTIAGGVIVYALGHLSVALIVEPIHRLRGLIGEIAYSLVFYASAYGNPGNVKQEIMDEAGETLRRQASELRAREHSIPCYPVWAVMKFVPGKENIREASIELVGLSNSTHGGPGVSPTRNIENAIKIQQLLGIEITKRKKKLGNKPESYLLHKAQANEEKAQTYNVVSPHHLFKARLSLVP